MTKAGALLPRLINDAFPSDSMRYQLFIVNDKRFSEGAHPSTVPHRDRNTHARLSTLVDPLD